ncbi:MAG: hypothetical protein AAF597_01945, partial [Bacteroidota bacterium]
MIHKFITPLLFVLFLCTCVPASLSAQCAGPTGQNTNSSDNGVGVQWTGGSTDALRQEHVISFCALEDPATGAVVSLEAINPSFSFGGLVPGTSYFIYVRNICDAGNGAEEASDWVTFTITTTGTAPTPAEDALANAVTLRQGVSAREVFSGEKVVATTLETNEAVCGYDNSWWYAFTPATTQRYTLSSGDPSATALTTDTDLSLGVYTGSAHPLTEVVCQNTNNHLGGGETITLSLTAGETYYLRVAMDDGARPCDIETSIEALPFVWEGSISNDWFTAGNWAAGAVPVAGQSVVIPANATQACVIANGDALAGETTVEGGSLTVAEGASLTVADGALGALITDNGNCTVNGTLTVSNVSGTGIDTDGGSLIVGATGTVEINSANAGITNANLEIDGTLMISNVTGTGIDTDGGLLTIGATGVVDIDTANEGIANGNF